MDSLAFPHKEKHQTQWICTYGVVWYLLDDMAQNNDQIIYTALYTGHPLKHHSSHIGHTDKIATSQKKEKNHNLIYKYHEPFKFRHITEKNVKFSEAAMKNVLLFTR